MKKVGGFIAGAFAIKQVVDFTKTCIDSASQVQAAFTGLNSIVEGTGNSFAQAQKFINDYTSDGLVSINEAATAYKNLLARGYDTSQIEDVLTRLKDSAAFGRQASYDLGEAVVTATEGLKNENSILVKFISPLIRRLVSAITRISVKTQRWTRPTRQFINAC